ncbi:ribosomal L7Ae/L30e/S12e/Gadd45 family protein [Oscillospiraceae bacterium 50-16]
MIPELSTADRVVGAKQVKRALKDGRAARLFMALDADPRMLQPLVQEAVNRQVPVSQVPTMKDLGAACGIAVGAAVAVLVKP